METMSYNKIKKKRSSYGVYAYFLFIILGTTLVAYSIINEPKPTIIGEDPLKNVEVYGDNDIAKEVSSQNTVDLDAITFNIGTTTVINKDGNFSINMTLPVISINSVNLEKINADIKAHYEDRANALLEQMKSAENSFTFKVTHKFYENKVGDRRVVSVTVHERIIDNAAGTTTTDRVDTYNIDLAEEKILSQEEVALDVLGTNYSALIREQVKSTVIASNMIKEEEYNYTITGLEQFYVKENKFHILLNEGEVVNKSYGVVDIAITK